GIIQRKESVSWRQHLLPPQTRLRQPPRLIAGMVEHRTSGRRVSHPPRPIGRWETPTVAQANLGPADRIIPPCRTLWVSGLTRTTRTRSRRNSSLGKCRFSPDSHCAQTGAVLSTSHRARFSNGLNRFTPRSDLNREKQHAPEIKRSS